MVSATPTGRGALLGRAIGHFAEHGVGDTSLRALAEAIGTSHRMLIYHFGSREGLLAEVTREVEARQRALLSTAYGSPSIAWLVSSKNSGP